MAYKDGGLEGLTAAAKKDPRYSKLKGEDKPDPEMDDEEAEGEGDGLDEVFSAKQAAAVRAYVADCTK